MHAEPLTIFGVQVVPLHHAVASQSLSVAHVVLHAPVPHKNGTHDETVGAAHAPVVVQPFVVLNVVPVHVVGHSPCGSVRTATLPQVPSAPEPFAAALHAWQMPLHAVAQQTPSAQKPERQS